MYTHYLQDNVIVSLHFMSLDMVILELWQVAGASTNLSICPLVTYLKDLLCHSLLLVALFIDAFTFFPWVLFGSSALVWVLGF